MDEKYGVLNGVITSLSTSDADNQFPLRDYYMNTAYNCCSGGSYRNDFVDICNLKAVLKQGVRCLDMEIYSVDGLPVVATSTVSDYFIKETYNSVDFSNVLDVINSTAFRGGACPNYMDPIILHLRVKSSQADVYSKMADIFKTYSPRMLGKEYSFENHNKNVGDVPILELMGKIIIVVDRENLGYLQNESFLEYVNLTSGSMFMRKYDYYGIKNNPDTGELTNYNRKNMTIVLPNKGLTDPNNPSPLLCRTFGCQMVAMRYQYNDNFLKMNIKMFNEAGYAFSLKPEELRYKPITIEEPIPQDPALSYQTREVKTDYYQFEF
jgi:hypothetical protein